MDADDRERVRRLFATMTERLETAYEAAVAGRADLGDAGAYARTARQLRAIVQQIASLADAALITAEARCIHLKSRPKSGPLKELDFLRKGSIAC